MRIGTYLTAALLMMAMLLTNVPQGQAATNIYYLAFGDSLAQGQTPFKDENGETIFDKGYPDYVAKTLKQSGYEVQLDNFGVTNSSSQVVLEQVKANADKIQNANIISISAGAIDFIEALKQNHFSPLGLDVEALLQGIEKNLVGMVSLIKAENPKAKLYVTGYYNALPYLSDEQQAIVNGLLTKMNSALKAAAIQAGFTYVPTAEIIAKNYIEYLPNPLDIHLSGAGYKAIGEQVAKYVQQELAEKHSEALAGVYWGKTVVKHGQTGKITIDKAINLWKREQGKLAFVRILKPGQEYRVYRWDNLYGGQYGLGAGYYVTNMSEHITFEPLSLEVLQKLKSGN